MQWIKEVTTMMSYYDRILLAIPTILIVGVTIGFSINISTQLTMALTSSISLGVITHGIIIRPPAPHNLKQQGSPGPRTERGSRHEQHSPNTRSAD
jgi:hypothetical protein